MKVFAPLVLSYILGLPGASPAEEPSPQEELAALDALHLDASAVYQVAPSNRIELHRADAVLSFDEGWIAFFSPLNGRVTGAVFSGRGHALAAPRDLMEKQQMALFLGAPLLDQDFSSAYLRFSDDTAADLLRQLRNAHVSAKEDTGFADSWEPALARLNPMHSLRLFFESLTPDPPPYFYAMLEGVVTGPFDFVFDQARREPVLFGQTHKTESGASYDVWASYRVPGIEPPPQAFHAVSYAIDTTIRPDNSIEGIATLRVRVDTTGERFLGLQLSRNLDIVSATDENGRLLLCFHNAGLKAQERAVRGNDYLYVVLPEAPQKGEFLTLHFRYHGSVIRDAGNGVLFVSDRESWYPRLGGTADFADYELTMRWPRRLRLAVTGTKLEEHEEGDYRVGYWRTEKPATVAGFNLGEYAFASFPSSGYSVDVYANRQLEQALLDRLRPPSFDLAPHTPVPFGMPPRSVPLAMPMPEPSPADALKQLGKEIDSSIHFFEKFNGPFPYRQLDVSQIPGTFGQGWPGLLYLSTYSFLPAQEQRRAGLSANSQEHFSDLVPFHEVAHQWWGNMVGWSSYRDQWIDEAMANYLALLFADTQKGPEHKLRVWLERYRTSLVQKAPGADLPAADYGSLELGSRLDSSKTPGGFELLVYGKGAWIIHMLREMLRQPGAKNPDARFIGLLHTLMAKYSYRALTTDELQHEIEAIMTPSMDLEDSHSMDWFFDEWIRGTGIPHYRIEYSARRTERGFLVRGKLYQSGVPKWFVAPVPLYSSSGTYLDRVIAGGPETTFHFVSRKAPGKIAIDPHMTLLCATEH
jgi:Peptidase family M1 domain